MAPCVRLPARIQLSGRNAAIRFARQLLTARKESMYWKPPHRPDVLLCLLLTAAIVSQSAAYAATCTTQSQMTSAQREALLNTARSIVADVQSGNLQNLQADTLPEIAANFGAVVKLVGRLQPLTQPATITVDNLYLLDASDVSAASQSDFYCGSPVVVFHFTNLPAGTYAVVFTHATGVPEPQEISLILAESPGGRWMLAGIDDKPMMAAGHDGLWYWVQARQYMQSNNKWDAWFYYHEASELLDPVSFLSSPNLQMLQQESEKARPANLPGTQPMTLTVDGENFVVTSVGETNTANWLDLDVSYVPDPAEMLQLQDSQTARQQAISIMSALLALHPELEGAFHGMWVHALQGTLPVYSLELPMSVIVSAPHPTAAASTPFTH